MSNSELWYPTTQMVCKKDEDQNGNGFTLEAF